MARIIGRKEILHILTGATLFGAGGGGPVQPAADMLDRLEREHGYSLEIELRDTDEMGAGEYAAMAAGLGSPLALIGKEFGPDSVRAFRVFQKALAMEGKTVSCLYSGELGGFNTFVPMLVSILSDRDPSRRIPLLDVDGNGRAVPELNTSLNSARLSAPAHRYGHAFGRRDHTIPHRRCKRRTYGPGALPDQRHADRLFHLGHAPGRATAERRLWRSHRLRAGRREFGNSFRAAGTAQ
jgi:hypothetical protein